MKNNKTNFEQYKSKSSLDYIFIVSSIAYFITFLNNRHIDYTIIVILDTTIHDTIQKSITIYNTQLYSTVLIKL